MQSWRHFSLQKAKQCRPLDQLLIRNKTQSLLIALHSSYVSRIVFVYSQEVTNGSIFDLGFGFGRGVLVSSLLELVRVRALLMIVRFTVFTRKTLNHVCFLS